LIIEDDPTIRQTIQNVWPVAEDALRFVSTYNQSLNLIFSTELAIFDAVILDIHLPDGDGLSILRTIRTNSSVPIVMISGSGTPESRAGMFEIGADDYIMKPFSVRELQARVARLVSVRTKAQPASSSPVFKIGPVDCDLGMKQLNFERKTASLTDAEARVIGYLHSHMGRNCAKSAIYKHVFFRDYAPGDKTLDVYIGRIRKKLAELDAASVLYLQTARGSGYKLEGARA